MDWLPHIVVRAQDDVSIPTSITALKTFSTGFPDTKATVHCIGEKALPFCKEWAKSGGHKLMHHLSAVKTSQLYYEITKATRLPVVLIAGTTVFYDNMSDYSTTKLFGADTVPAWNISEDTINIKSIEKTIIFVAKPIQVINTLNDLTKNVTSYVAAEGKNSSLWSSQNIIMDGKIYKQTSGIYNMLYNYDTSFFTNFSKKTADKYETVFGGSSISSTMAKLKGIGKDTSKIMEHVNAAMNDDWEGVKGMREDFLKMIS